MQLSQSPPSVSQASGGMRCRWVTEPGGQKVYYDKTGKKMTGSKAYKASKADSAKLKKAVGGGGDGGGKVKKGKK